MYVNICIYLVETNLIYHSPPYPPFLNDHLYSSPPPHQHYKKTNPKSLSHVNELMFHPFIPIGMNYMEFYLGTYLLDYCRPNFVTLSGSTIQISCLFHMRILLFVCIDTKIQKTFKYKKYKKKIHCTLGYLWKHHVFPLVRSIHTVSPITLFYHLMTLSHDPKSNPLFISPN